MQQDMFAKAERDRALGTISANAGPWLLQGILAIRSIKPGWCGTGEDIRLELARRGLSAPHHHNAWGALIKRAQEKRLIRKTGRSAHMRTKKSHARLTPVYVKL